MSSRGRGCKFGRTVGVLSLHSRVSLAPDTTAIDRHRIQSTVKALGHLTRPDEAALQLSIKERSLSPGNQPQVVHLPPGAQLPNILFTIFSDMNPS